jgi:hypothetical protein
VPKGAYDAQNASLEKSTDVAMFATVKYIKEDSSLSLWQDLLNNPAKNQLFKYRIKTMKKKVIFVSESICFTSKT